MEDGIFSISYLPLATCSWPSSGHALQFGSRDVRIVAVGQVVRTEYNLEIDDEPMFFSLEVLLMRHAENKTVQTIMQYWGHAGEHVAQLLLSHPLTLAHHAAPLPLYFKACSRPEANTPTVCASTFLPARAAHAQTT